MVYNQESKKQEKNAFLPTTEKAAMLNIRE